jgi:hypothetical protein
MYAALKSFVARRGGHRLAMHRSARDRLVEIAVEEFPVGADPSRIEEVLRAKVRIRVREQYGAILASIIIGVMVNLIVRLVIEWWFENRSHQVLMEGWRALASPPVPPPQEGGRKPA